MLQKGSIWLFAILLTVLFTQCSDDDSIVTLNEEGDLIVTIIDTEGEPITNTEVELYYSGTTDPMYTGTTDSEGLIDFGTVFSGVYTVSFTTTHNNYDFDVENNVLVVAGNTNEKTISLSDYIGTLEVSIINGYTYEDRFEMSGIDIAIVANDESLGAAVGNSEIIALAIVTGVTDANGQFETEIPVGDYLVYTLNESDIYTTDFISEYEFYESTAYSKMYITPIDFILSEDKEWEIVSVTTQDETPVDVETNYLTLTFNENTEYALLTVSGEDENLEGSTYVSHYANGSEGYQAYLSMDFTTPSYVYIYGDITLEDSGDLTWECYDTNMGQSLIITLR